MSLFKDVLLIILGLSIIMIGLLILVTFPHWARAIENTVSDNTAENVCNRNNGDYSFLGFSGDHRCYINGYKHDIYMSDGIWKVSRRISDVGGKDGKE